MPLPNIKNRVGNAVSGTPGTGPITLASAETSYQSFSTAYGANANVDITIEEGALWENCRDCTFDFAANTVTRGTLEDGSSGTSARVAFTSVAKVYVIESAARMTQQTANINSIDGLLCGYSAATTAAITAGYCWIEGVRYAQASATTLSLSSGNEIGGSSITADKLLFIYAYNNAGSIAYKWDLRSTTGDDPLLSEEWQYWYHPSNGVSYRLIGVMRTQAAVAELHTPDVRAIGKRGRVYVNKGILSVLTVNGTTEGSIALAAYVPKNATALICVLGGGVSTTPALIQAVFSLRTGAGTNGQAVAKGYAATAANTLLFGQNTIRCASTDSLYVTGSTADEYARVFYVGFEYEV